VLNSTMSRHALRANSPRTDRYGTWRQNGRTSARNTSTRLKGTTHVERCLPIGGAEVNAPRFFLVRVSPLVHAPEGGEARAAHRHKIGSAILFPPAAIRAAQINAKNIASDGRPKQKRFFMTKDFATGLVGIPWLNLSRSLLGLESALVARAT
jgi:hypothetical protein